MASREGQAGRAEGRVSDRADARGILRVHVYRRGVCTECVRAAREGGPARAKSGPAGACVGGGRSASHAPLPTPSTVRHARRRAPWSHAASLCGPVCVETAGGLYRCVIGCSTLGVAARYKLQATNYSTSFFHITRAIAVARASPWPAGCSVSRSIPRAALVWASGRRAGRRKLCGPASRRWR